MSVKRQGIKKGIYLIPNLLTTGNMFSGFYSIIASLGGEYIYAAVAILIAVVFDGLDGKVARMTKSTSRFGIEYDSLADLVSFGMAPALLIYSWALNSYGWLGWVAAFLLVVFGALRLARFNVQVGTVESKHFIGLPIPAAASVIATTVILDQHFLGMGREIRPLVILLITYLMAFLMVSTIRYRSFKDFNLQERKPFRVLVGAVLILIAIVAQPQAMVFLIFVLYALSGVVEHFFGQTIRRTLALAGVEEKEVEGSPLEEEEIADRDVVVSKRAMSNEQ
jgi:CDP-diacylglycerol--serine O-phosphatidyltransferase